MSDKLNKKQKEELQKLTDEMMSLATEVVEDYEKDPSEISGSVIEINENSPFLEGEWKNNSWQKVIRGSVEDAMLMMKGKNKKITPPVEGETCMHGNSWHSGCSECDEMDRKG